jgi:hypothetical protein
VVLCVDRKDVLVWATVSKVFKTFAEHQIRTFINTYCFVETFYIDMVRIG